MKISIITPCYNYGQYLSDAVSSVRSQIPAESELGDLSIEHIVVDGGSADGTVEWLQTYVSKLHPHDGYKFKFVSEQDKGQTDAINKGLRMATGEIVCWLNADERYQKNALKVIADSFKKHPQVDIVYGEPLFTNSDGKVIKHKKEHRFDRNVLLYCGCYITSCCTFWRRRILDEGHLLDDSYKATMDFEYYVRLMKMGYSFLYVPQAIASFMWHDSNVSTVYADVRRRERILVQRKYGIKVPLMKETPEWILDGLAAVYRLKRVLLKLPHHLSS